MRRILISLASISLVVALTLAFVAPVATAAEQLPVETTVSSEDTCDKNDNHMLGHHKNGQGMMRSAEVRSPNAKGSCH